VLRSPAYAWHDPAVLAPDVPHRFQDQGIQRLRYRLLPHTGSWQSARVPAAGAVLNGPVTAVLDSNHPGTLPLQRSFGRVRSGSVMLTVLKAGQDDPSTVVLRAYETDGEATVAEIELPMLERTLTLDFGPCEIKTVLVPRDPSAPAVECNLLEWADGAPSATG
jgi:alpha-mannosidase